MSARAASEYRPREVALAVMGALAVEVATVVLLSAVHVDRPAAALDEPVVVPVRAVALHGGGLAGPDAPLLKLGGKPRRSGGPEQPVAPAAAATTAPAPPTPQDAISLGEGEPRKESPASDGAMAGQVEAPAASEPAAGAPEGPGGPGGEGSAAGTAEGTETDPLKARAVDLYRGRIIAWFSRRFRVQGSGLPQDQLTRLRVSATVEIGADRRVLSYTIVPSGVPAFDAAARAALNGSIGGSIPPPPENYPDVVQRRIYLTFVCTRNQCD